MTKYMTQDHKWIHEHFEELVGKYAGKYVAVANGELVAVGETAGEVDSEARKKYAGIIPSVLLVPREEDFVCAL
ncbi:hypothetical protein AC481_05995 [miscellaneous Crenarchaeota group archaeon SMTZ-80]|nr:MAG: hypothetical protein AC481_05995 [miscellaneous Crenarchaeota group archaeon SMTZ-80]